MYSDEQCTIPLNKNIDVCDVDIYIYKSVCLCVGV